MSLISAKTLVWGGGSYLNLIRLYLDSIGREADFVFSDSGEPTPILEIPDRYPEFNAAAKQCDSYVVCIGNSYGYRRNQLSVFLRETCHLKPLSLIHPTAYVCPTAQISSPIVVMPRAIIGSYARFGKDCIVNTNAVIEHECVVGDGVHVMGSAVLTGRVSVGSFSTIGTNATVLPDLAVGSNSFVGAGAVVTKNVSDNLTVIGVPAKPLQD